MTPEEQRIKIAELCGWTKIKEVESSWPPDMGLPKEWIGYPPDYPGPNEPHIAFSEVPNYPEDLNACADMEATLSKYELDIMDLELWKISRKETGDMTWRATAARRCGAFLKVKGFEL